MKKDICNSTIAAYAAFLRASFRLLCQKTQPDTPDTETVWETVSEAYIYAFPLVLTDATKTLSTNTDGTMTGRAPINQFNHAKKAGGRLFPHRRDAERRYRLFAGMA